MIITEIKHLNVRISEFEDNIIDDNILPIFATPLILKEVAARKRSKYNIETLNPERKLTFRIVTHSEIVAELAARINKVAFDLEPYYFIDPSHFHSLPLKIKDKLESNLLLNKIKNIEASSIRYKLSTIKGKKLILYIRFILQNILQNKVKSSLSIQQNEGEGYCVTAAHKKILYYLKINRKILKFQRSRYRQVKNYFSNLSYKEQIKALLKVIIKKKKQSLTIFNKKKYVKNHYRINKILYSYVQQQEKHKNLLLIFSGLVPTSKGALKLLDDEGWDLDLLSNKNKKSQQKKKLKPYNLRKFRRLRRLKRLRLMSINLFTHRSENIKKKFKQGIAPLQHSNATSVTTTQHSSLINKNKYLIKHNNNKLNFIVNWIGDKKIYNNNNNNLRLNKNNDNLKLNRTNISNIFLTQFNIGQPIRQPINDYLYSTPYSLINSKINLIKEQVDRQEVKKNKYALLLRKIEMADKKEILNQIDIFKSKRINGLKKLNEMKLKKKKRWRKKKNKNNNLFNSLNFNSSSTPAAPMHMQTGGLQDLLTKNKMRSAAEPKKQFKNKAQVKIKQGVLQDYLTTPLNFKFNERNLSTAASQQPNTNQVINNNNENDYKGDQWNAIKKNNNFSKRLNFIIAKHKSWKKKKKLSLKLLKKTSRRFANLQVNKNIIFDTAKREIVSNKIKIKNNLYNGIKDINLNKFKLSTNPLLWGAAEREPDLWKNIINLIKPSSKLTDTKLFWVLIKLYSSLFNPMLSTFNFNNSILPQINIFSKSNAQIKLLKVNNDVTAQHSIINNKILTKNLTRNNNNNIKSKDKNITLINNNKNKLITSLLRLRTQEERNNASKAKPLLKYNTQDKGISINKTKLRQLQLRHTPSLKLKPVKYWINYFKPKLININEGFKEKKEKLKLIGIRTGRKGWSKVMINKAAQYYKSQHSLKSLNYDKVEVGPKGEQENKLKILKHLNMIPDNKRFLFLYFILPIFFSTINNNYLSTAQPAGVTKPYFKAKVNLNNQKNQLRSLFKLMLNSNVLSNKRLHINWLNLSVYTAVPALRTQQHKSLTRFNKLTPKLNVKNKNIKTLMEAFNNNLLLFNKDKKNLIKVKSNFNLENLALNLIKWTVLFIVQSLKPLKKKQEYYSLILLKIFKNNKLISAPLLQRERIAPTERSTAAGVEGAALQDHTNNKINQDNQIKIKPNQPNQIITEGNVNVNSLQERGKIIPSMISVSGANAAQPASHAGGEPNKENFITFYPGGRFISDWKKITKAIWQEEFIFNANYKRIKNSLNLTKNITNNKIKYNKSLINALPIKSNNYEAKALTKEIIHNTILNLVPSNEFIKSYNNLINAKSTIIGKIKSIKLIQLVDKLKEEILIAEQLEALVRVADFTDLNKKNKKKYRQINASKYLNKKKINKSNRIKILQTIKTIKTDFNFESKIDGNSLSIVPVPLLYYSNLNKIKVKRRSFNHYENIIQKSNPILSAYLREMSIYNRETKGIINYYSRIIGYNFNSNNNKISSSIFDLLEASFRSMRCFISKPVFVFSSKKITIQLFYFLLVINNKKLFKIKRKLRSRWISNHKRNKLKRLYTRKKLRIASRLNKSSLNELFPEQLKSLCENLNKIFNKPVELNLIRLHYPSGDPNILVKIMGVLINNVRLSRIFKNLFSGTIIKSLIHHKKRKNNNISIIPAFLTGLNIKIAGRIMTENARPRHTVNLMHRGAIAKGKVNYLNFARLTNKNKRGSYSISIIAGQNYFK